MAIFYQGELRDAISQAIQEFKHVACFMKDESPESRRWEDEYLHDAEVAAEVGAKAIVIPLKTGSQEAAYLAAFYPVSVAPSLILIKNGTLCGDLQSGLSLVQFRNELLKILEPSLSDNTNNFGSHIPPAAEIAANPRQNLSSGPSSTTQETVSLSNTDVHNALEEQRKRLEADKQRKDAVAKAELLKQAEMRKAELDKVPADPARAQQVSYAQQQRKRQQEARQERERILQIIENDKLERKRKEELRKALANHDGADGLVDQQPFQDIDGSITRKKGVCALQVRLLDGSVIRSKFPSTSTLRADVRKWVEERESVRGVPYNFRQVLTPEPNRLISVSEEEEYLDSLGLTPNATLVIVPVLNYVNAHTCESGLVSRALSAGYNGISQGLGWVGGFLYQRQPSTPQSLAVENPQESSSASRSRLNLGSNIRTLGNERWDTVEKQFYNGNQLNFEPRNEDDE
ncbi:MAG: hypothetical protein MMC33_008810 [Icmadophila ericetorum]|nr:hypothetical protein [Icmadophila ericetorum]